MRGVRAGRLALRAAGVVAAGTTLGLTVAHGREKDGLEAVKHRLAALDGEVPSRSVQIAALQGSSPASPFDILVIGGGATGSGVALDAATRGLRVGLVERDDFAAGSSSRSTKLVHGGPPPCTAVSFQSLLAADLRFLRYELTQNSSRGL